MTTDTPPISLDAFTYAIDTLMDNRDEHFRQSEKGSGNGIAKRAMHNALAEDLAAAVSFMCLHRNKWYPEWEVG